MDQLKYEVANDSVVLEETSALSYPLPPNTTLVRVLGPTVVDTKIWDECFAILDPSPSWWQPQQPYLHQVVQGGHRSKSHHVSDPHRP